VVLTVVVAINTVVSPAAGVDVDSELVFAESPPPQAASKTAAHALASAAIEKRWRI